MTDAIKAREVMMFTNCMLVDFLLLFNLRDDVSCEPVLFFLLWSAELLEMWTLYVLSGICAPVCVGGVSIYVMAITVLQIWQIAAQASRGIKFREPRAWPGSDTSSQAKLL